MTVFTPNALYTFRRGSLPTAVAACAYRSRAAIWVSNGVAARSFMNERRLELETGIWLSPLSVFEACDQTRRWEQLILILRQRNFGSHRQDVRVASGLVLVVKTHRAVRAEVVGVSWFCWMAAFDAVRPASGNHVPLPVNDKVDFFCDLVMMGKVGAARSEIHPEQASHDVSLIDRVARGGARAHEQLVEHRSGVALNRFLAKLVHVDDSGLAGRRSNCNR